MAYADHKSGPARRGFADGYAEALRDIAACLANSEREAWGWIVNNASDDATQRRAVQHVERIDGRDYP